ncbi:Uncharacterized protein ycf66 at N-terminal half [Coccomyxa sp. Obi]|nr:Uncharacterized protein ycf66 at N-terminal half [Coccomyxa sp. Obi]
MTKVCLLLQDYLPDTCNQWQYHRKLRSCHINGLRRSHTSARRAPSLRRLGRVLALDTRAMVNVDFSPALLLGMSLIASGLALYQLRRVQPDISRDFDVIVSAVATFSGGILIFQGWRLDPLLLFCQLLTAGTALGFAVESLRLRQEVRDIQRSEEDPAKFSGRMDGFTDSRRQPLPPPQQESFRQWSGSDWRESPSRQDVYAPDGPSGSYSEEVPGYSGRDRFLDVEIESDNGYYSQGDDRQTEAGRGQEYTGAVADKARRPGGLERWSPLADTSTQDDWD